ncbi:unnamed protein product [Caenorhabditis auriculariae]|uniref:Uncharacterized protein n=1 Tax=Caenorhabditis auriculariae TaxID=2777116 RepID=A0A8S1HU81_9PELO|nr:unnamed protein product [Caenorhabditis auriculariae]
MTSCCACVRGAFHCFMRPSTSGESSNVDKKLLTSSSAAMTSSDGFCRPKTLLDGKMRTLHTAEVVCDSLSRDGNSSADEPKTQSVPPSSHHIAFFGFSSFFLLVDRAGGHHKSSLTSSLALVLFFFRAWLGFDRANQPF